MSLMLTGGGDMSEAQRQQLAALRRVWHALRALA